MSARHKLTLWEFVCKLKKTGCLEAELNVQSLHPVSVVQTRDRIAQKLLEDPASTLVRGIDVDVT